jgi:hypothetical protein
LGCKLDQNQGGLSVFYRNTWLYSLQLVTWVASKERTYYHTDCLLANIMTESSRCLWECDRWNLRTHIFICWFAWNFWLIVIYYFLQNQASMKWISLSQVCCSLSEDTSNFID